MATQNGLACIEFAFINFRVVSWQDPQNKRKLKKACKILD